MEVRFQFKVEDFAAALEYMYRARRITTPVGKFDHGGRWYPDKMERRPCCDGIYPPSRRWGNTLLKHCYTAVHCARLHGANEGAVRKIAKLLEGFSRETLAAIKCSPNTTTTPQGFIAEFIRLLRGGSPQAARLIEVQSAKRLAEWFALPEANEIDWEGERVLASLVAVGGDLR